MDESFLHYIWKFQFFYKPQLTTTSGLRVQVMDPGRHNKDAGPDFLNAKVLIGEIEWNGSIEIHINEKDWFQHHHNHDKAYDNVVLHVVWKSNSPSTYRSDGSDIPVIELKDRIDYSLFENYQRLISAGGNILCGGEIKHLDRLKVWETLDKAVVTRLRNKAEEIQVRLRKNNNDWEETCFQLLASNFGFKVNKGQFLDLAQKIPFKVLQKHTDQLEQVEAVLFGMAGFLDEQPKDSYQEKLTKEYHFLRTKYQFNKILERHHWKFLRLRPANFPTVRLAQFARLVSTHQKLFSMFLSIRDIQVLRENLQCRPSEYWQSHYDFAKMSEKPVGRLGEESINNIIINTCVPLLAAYAIEKDEDDFLDRALFLLQKINPEKNSIVNEWKNVGVRIASAFDSQGCIELMNNYCLRKKCLECTIGVAVLKAG